MYPSDLTMKQYPVSLREEDVWMARPRRTGPSTERQRPRHKKDPQYKAAAFPRGVPTKAIDRSTAR